MQPTSRAAKKSLETATLRDRVYNLIASSTEGATDEEVEIALGLKHQTASARRRELVQAGRVVDSGSRRPTTSGRQAIVWRVAVSKSPPPPKKKSAAEQLEIDAGQAAVLAAAAAEVLTGCEQRLHWVVDLRDRRAHVMNASSPTEAQQAGDLEFSQLLMRFRDALDGQNQVESSCKIVLTAAQTMYSTGAQRSVTYALHYRVSLDRFMRYPPPMGHWLLWPLNHGSNYGEDENDQMADAFWYENIPF